MPVSTKPLVVNGWTIFVHLLFLDALDALTQQVKSLRLKDTVGYTNKNASKRLAAIARLAFDVIPQDPTRSEYRQGHTLGGHHKHWFRAKFFQQYRLFFCYHLESKIIVYAWLSGNINDSDSKRAYESASRAGPIGSARRENKPLILKPTRRKLANQRNWSLLG